MVSITTSHPTAAAVQEEQRHLDLADARRRDLVRELGDQLATPVIDRVDAQRHALLRTRTRRLEEAADGLVLGRVDTLEGQTWRIGRTGVPAADDGPPLVLDWRADAARPFYTATALEPQGLRRRRHVRVEGTRVISVDDEDLTATQDDGDDDLVGEAALLAALDERRTGRMGTAVATLQREQDAIVRAAADPALVVQGGPGTGKTVVALHRVAYLLFARPEIARRGVLLLGPSRRFLDYVQQVLPALGETAVVAATCETLLAAHPVERTETREIAEVKGRAAWWPTLHSHVEALTPAAADLRLVLDGEQHVLPRRRVEAALRAARAGDRPWHDARAIALESLREALLDQVVERSAALLAHVEDGLEDVLGTVDAALSRRDDRGARTQGPAAEVDGELSEADIDDLRTRIAGDAWVRDTFDRWWPRVDAATELRRLLHDPALLQRHAGWLTAAERAAVVAEPAPLAPSDIALLDALIGLLGDPEPVVADEEFVAGRAATDPLWTFGHVAVDEAQELSPMHWHMVRRRCPTGSITAVGDIDQTEAAHPHTDWSSALGGVLGDRWQRTVLTICYRTPREVMGLVAPVLAAAGSRNTPPRAVRSSGHEPRLLLAAPGTLVDQVVAVTTELAERYRGGTVGVVTAAAHLGALRTVLPDLPVVPPLEAKGLEWDAVVVVDPDAIASGPRGHNALYVALTRCTQELVQIGLAHGTC